MGAVSIEHDATATVTAATARGSISIEGASLASVTHDEVSATIALASSSPSSLTIDTSAVSVEIATAAPATITIDAQSTPAISAVEHDSFDTLAHAIAESCVTDYEYDGDGNVTRVVSWASAARETKVRESSFVYSAGLLTASTTTQHNGAGAIVATLTLSFTHDGDGKVTSKTTTRS